MDSAVNSQFNSGTNLFILTRACGFRSCDPQHTLSEKSYPRLSHPDRKKSRLFSKRDQASRHKFTIGRPGWVPLASQSTKVLTLLRSLFLSSLNFKSHPCRASKSVPPGPELPKSFCATKLTTSSVISIGIKIGVYLYTSNLEQGGGGGVVQIPPRQERCGNFINNSSFIRCQFIGLKPPPVSYSQTNMTASHNFPCRTKFENV